MCPYGGGVSDHGLGRMRALAAGVVLCVVLVPAAEARVRAERIGKFDQPVYVAGVPGGGLAVVERAGRIRELRHGRLLRRPLADLRARVLIQDPDETVDQRGLLSLAFAPDYARSRRLYVIYIDRSGRERVDVVKRGARGGRRVLDLGPAPTQHHGGQLQFGPDGRLWVSTGMGSNPQASQDPVAPGGKLLAVDVRAQPPQVSVMALGLRNPWRFSFDPSRRAILLGDVGEQEVEEIDVLPVGAGPAPNFGWPFFEGLDRREPGPPGLRPPALTMRHADGWCAVVGGYVVRRAGPRALRGRYVFGDVCTGKVWSARLVGGRLEDDRPSGLTIPYLVSFGEDSLGRLYAVSFVGSVVRLR
jgi:glucose/arabinose dehydrogenase